MMNTNYRLVCAWCGAHLRGSYDAPHVSHGICPWCLKDHQLITEAARAQAYKAAPTPGAVQGVPGDGPQQQ